MKEKGNLAKKVGGWAQVEGLALSRVTDNPQTDGRDYRRSRFKKKKTREGMKELFKRVGEPTH